MRILDKRDIQNNFDFDKAVEAIRMAYISASTDSASIAPVGHIAFPDNNGDCHIKSGHIKGDDFFVIKIATGFYDNPRLGKPSSNGVMVVFSAMSGEPVALLKDEGWLTDMRTGIGGAITTIELAPKNAKNVLLIGTGLQCRFQADCLSRLNPDIYQYSVWGRSLGNAKKACEDLSSKGLEIKPATDLEEEVKKADIIITTTPSTEHIVRNSWVSASTHITAIGADSLGKRELDTDLLHRADLLVSDLNSQSLDHGEFQAIKETNSALKPIEIGNIFNETESGRISEESITIADLTGIAPQDIAITGTVLV